MFTAAFDSDHNDSSSLAHVLDLGTNAQRCSRVQLAGLDPTLELPNLVFTKQGLPLDEPTYLTQICQIQTCAELYKGTFQGMQSSHRSVRGRRRCRRQKKERWRMAEEIRGYLLDY